MPPAQRKAKLNQKIDEIRKQIAHETAERLVYFNTKLVFTNTRLIFINLMFV